MDTNKVFKMKKILVLVMSHETNDETFKTYKKVWEQKISYIRDKYPIDILFLYADNNIETEYVVVENSLISKCEENYWSALLKKVLSGFKVFNDGNYDLVFKTNLSTIINFDVFYDYCQSVNLDGFIYQGNIGTYLDYKFCSGAGMLLNKKSVELILNNIDKIDETWTDDIFIGYILNKVNNIEPTLGGFNRFDILSDIPLNENIKKYTHVRIKIRKDNKDIYYTNKVFDLIYG
jgi:hypothetical protein